MEEKRPDPMVIQLKRMPALFLCGFMGCGKSTIGPALADELGWDFIDLDSEIEAAQHTTIAEIFRTRGEAEFRRLETEALRSLMAKIARGVPAVVALGGGAFVQSANFELLDGHAITIWLDCPFETIERRLDDTSSRPLAADPVAFRRLFDERRPAYSRASYRVDSALEPAAAVQTILALPCWK